MDTSKEYVKMCDCKEIQELWKTPKKGDYYFPMLFNYVCIYHEDEPFDWDDNIYLPRQDQLQEMLKIDGLQTLCTVIEQFSKSLYGSGFTIRGTMEQLWLAFVMSKKYNKIWIKNKWKNKEK